MRLLVIRHAKAQQDSPTGADRDRHLNAVGLQCARDLAHTVAARPDLVPDRIISSPAMRTMQTAGVLADQLDISVEFDERLAIDQYASNALELVREICDQDPNIDAFAIVGHMPTVAEIVAVMALGPAAPAAHIRTGQCVVLEFDDPEPGAATVIESIDPRA